MSRGWRNVCFTLWLPLTDDWTLLDPSLWPDVAYCVYQLENGKNPGSDRSGLHYQGYIEFIGQKRIDWMHENLEGMEGAHYEQRKGTQMQARQYCMKDDTHVEGPWEHGELKEQGKRNDIVDFKRSLDDRKTEEQLWDDHFAIMMRYPKAAKAYKRVKRLETIRDWKPEIEVYIGPSGCGKTRLVREKYPDAYWKPHGPWWDGYIGQETVIFDEFYGYRMQFSELLNTLDSSPMQVQPKGDFVQLIAKKYVFTSNQEPELWYNGEKTHQMVWALNPLNRRLTDFGTFFRWPEPPNPNPPGFSRQLNIVKP